MTPIGSNAALPAADPNQIRASASTPAKIREAAQQFEALLLGQILRSMRESGGGWLGSKDSASDCATEFAEQHLASMLAQNGGIGLAGLIAQGLERGEKP